MARGDFGITVSATTVARFLHNMGYSLRVNHKQLATDASPDRNEQFLYIGDLRDLSVVKSLSAAGFVHLDSKNYREVEVTEKFRIPVGKQVRRPRRHRASIRLERFWIYEGLFRQHPATRIDDASHRCA
jgi:hypothetical protein